MRARGKRVAGIAPAIVAAFAVGSGDASCGGSSGAVADAGASSSGGGATSSGGFAGGDAAGGGDGGGHPTPTGPVTIDDCASGASVSQSVASMLQAGGPVDPAMRWLYPYDKTVFPGGILPAVLQWVPQSGGADAVYVHMRSSLFEYRGCFGANPKRQLAVPDKAWTTAWQQSTGANDPLTVELTTLAGSTVSGPISEQWTWALGSLKGVVYYNTYTSPQVANNGAVMVIAPGAAQPMAFLSIPGTAPVGPCISCHSLSSNGSMLVAQRHKYPPGLVQSESYDLMATPAPNPSSPLAKVTTDDWGFSAVYPDGSRLLTDGTPNKTGAFFPAAAGNNPGMVGPAPSKMFDPRTGSAIPFTGLAAKYAMMPSFSPDGTKVVFNDYDAGMGHSLTVMDFDPATNTFSNPKQIYSDPSRYPGWPFFTPDSRWIAFALGDSSNFASLYNPPLPRVARGDLWMVDVATGTAHSLDAANGLSASGSSLLPYPGRDEHLDFYPTVSPVPAGGYFWVFFTSRRNYGNVLVDPNDGAPSKKIWVTALTIGAGSGSDVSHPAFYLPGQELGSGNIRAFATLAPCKPNGPSCTTGIDCCGGTCNAGQCSPEQGCSPLDGRCSTAKDCCNTSLQCINGFCSAVSQ
jgi:hypothetical protein